MSIGKPAGGPHPTLALDETLLGHNIREFSELLDGRVTLFVTDSNGKTLWCSTDHPTATFDEMEGLRAPSEVVLRINERAYNFPPTTLGETTVGIRLCLEHPTPPGLDEVSQILGSKIECLVRQIAIDTNLTSRHTVGEQALKELDLIAEINSFDSTHSIDDSIAELVALCESCLSCEAVVVAVPKRRLLAVAPSQSSLEPQLNDIVARLNASLTKKRRVISARFTLKDGSDQGALCSPILNSQRHVEGLVLILGQSPRNYSKIARTLSSKIASLQQSRRTSSRLLDRGQIVEKIESLRSKNPETSHSFDLFRRGQDPHY